MKVDPDFDAVVLRPYDGLVEIGKRALMIWFALADVESPVSCKEHSRQGWRTTLTLGAPNNGKSDMI
jgi:hypothetical protein